MKKVAVVFLVTAVAAFSQCTPDAGITILGIYPRNLPNGRKGFLTIRWFNLRCLKRYYRLYSGFIVFLIAGGPAGNVNYQCNKPTCGYKGNANGCAVLTAPLGAGSAGMYTLNVSVMVKSKSPIPFCPSGNQNVFQYTRFSSWPTCRCWRYTGRQGNQGLVLYPNPASRMVNVSIQAERSQQTLLTLLDMHGSGEQARVNVNNGSNTVTLWLDAVPLSYWLRFV